MNNYQTQQVKIISVNQVNSDSKLFKLAFNDKKNQKNFNFVYDQFMQVGLPGWGECPISICSSPDDSQKFFELAVRDAGSLTKKINSLKNGDKLTVRGPFGNGIDTDKLAGKNVVLVGGGCGFFPLRPIINDYYDGKLALKKLTVLYGCANEQTLAFSGEYKKWQLNKKLFLILDKPTAQWRGRKGLITALIKEYDAGDDDVYILVGPPVMYKYSIQELAKKKAKPENIFLSLEKKMYCGVGVCQHCALGPYYVCKDGPVFSWQQLKNIPHAI